LDRLARVLNSRTANIGRFEEKTMLTEMQCPDCFGRCQKVEMKLAKFGHPVPPYQACPRCAGTGKVPYPKPVKVWKRKSMRRVT